MQDSKVCPRYATPADAWPWMDLYRHYQDGHLLRSGGIEEQPALYLSVMRLIDGVVKESRDGR
jgi:hypothetical protein